MRKTQVIHELETAQLKKDVPEFYVGDTVAVHIRIIEGSKERVQVFTGTVIARKGSGSSETFSLHRVAYGEGMERVFLLHSPRVAKIEVVHEGQVRRAKLYHLRGTQGKAAKVKRRLVPRAVENKARAAKQAAEARASKPVKEEAPVVAEAPAAEKTSTDAAE